ncbi:MAG: DNA-processing protein DprA [Saprospiraceae bacterium]|nr:DNA-processing protein DprA [Saprospiraceae bacterium]
MGSGMSHIYPSEHKDLYKMVTKGGAVMTEFAHNIGPEKVNFPLRNRIIAAMSDALIVVESKDRGGSIITAEFANEYNKDVFAITKTIRRNILQVAIPHQKTQGIFDGICQGHCLQHALGREHQKQSRSNSAFC